MHAARWGWAACARSLVRVAKSERCSGGWGLRMHIYCCLECLLPRRSSLVQGACTGAPGAPPENLTKLLLLGAPASTEKFAGPRSLYRRTGRAAREPH